MRRWVAAGAKAHWIRSMDVSGKKTDTLAGSDVTSPPAVITRERGGFASRNGDRGETTPR